MVNSVSYNCRGKLGRDAPACPIGGGQANINTSFACALSCCYRHSINNTRGCCCILPRCHLLPQRVWGVG